MTQPTFGYLGTGHLASYTVKALRNGGYSGKIVLSPRNAEVAARLAADDDCEIAPDNQSVIDAADIVVLSVRPGQLDRLLDGLVFAPEKTVLSAVAGISIDRLRRHANLPPAIVRFMPSSFIEAGEAVFPLYPANKVIERTLGACGRTIVFDSEAQFEMSVLTSCAYAWTYELMEQMIRWFVRAGWPESVAREMVVRHVRGSTTYALANAETPLPEILDGIATQGTYTLSGLEHLRKADAFTPWLAALDHLAAKVRPD